MSAETPTVSANASIALREDPRPAMRSAGRLVTVGLALGVLGQLLFFAPGLGLNVPLAVAAILLAGWRLRPPDRPLRPTDAWLPAAALAYAAFVALRGDSTLVALDLLAALVLTGASLAALGGFTVASRPLVALLRLMLRFAGWTAAAASWALFDVRPRLAAASSVRGRSARAAPIARGLLIGLPLVLVFVALFSAADAVFARMVADLVGIDLDPGEMIGRLLLALSFGWLATGAVAFTAAAQPETEVAPSAALPRLGTVEAITSLLIVDVVFAVFVGLQGAYLFGGLDTLQAAGLTYAEYARRGFVELIAVVFVAGGLVFALETFVARRSRAYVGAAIGLALLSAVVLASAFLRLRLYQEAYGWTELRFYAVAMIAWLAIGVALAVGALATNRTRWLPNGLIAVALLIGLAVNVIGPVRFVAQVNLARALDPGLVAEHGSTGLDDLYLYSLDTDAVAPMAEALPRLDGGAQRDVAQVLELWRAELADQGAWQEWNLSRVVARDALD